MAIEDQREALRRVLARRPARPVKGSNQKLAGSINAGLEETGADPGILGAGLNVLGRGFDLLSRPLYGVANFAESIAEGENVGQAVREGVTEGVTGKDKTTFSEVLDQVGVENRAVRGVAGFGLDVALDPLTYVGVGLVRKASQEAIEAAGAKAVQGIVREAAEKGSVTAIKADTAGIGAYREAIRSGVKDTSILDKVKQTARQDFIEQEAMNVGRVAKEAASVPGSVTLKFMGKELGSSQGLYRAGGSAITKLKGTQIGNALNKAFRPEATFVSGTNSIRRMTESAGWANGEKIVGIFDNGGNIDGFEVPAFRSLDEQAAKDVAHALEAGIDLSPQQLEAFTSAFRNLADDLYDVKDGMFIGGDPNLPLTLGKPKVANYVPHFFDRSIDSSDDLRDWYARRNRELTKLDKQQTEGAQRALQEAYQASKKANPPNSKGEVLRAQAVRAAAKVQGIKDKVEIQRLIDEAEEGFHLEEARKAAIKWQEDNPIVSTYTLERAASEGLHPITDIRQIGKLMIKDHVSEVGRLRYSQAVANEFGVQMEASLAKRLGLRTVKSKYIPEGTYFPKEIADTFKKMDHVFYQDEAAGAGLIKLIDNVTRKMKFMQTVFNPGHHIRNGMGDIVSNFMDGVTRLEPYDQAIRMLKSINKADSSLFTTAGEAGPSLQQSLEVLDDIKIKVGRAEISGSQIWNNFMESGAKSGFFSTELGPESVGFVEKVRKISELREDTTRLAHFIDAFQKEGKNIKSANDFVAIKKAAERAAQRVRKFNIDYGNLTPFEQRVLRRIVPFYTWMRKNTPLQIENFLMRPGKQAIAPKGINALKTILGNNDPEDTEIDGLNYLPDYMRQAFSVALTGEGEGRNGIYWNPNSLFPVMGLDNVFGSGSPRDIVQGQLAGLHPGIQIPIQQITDYNFFTGRQDDKSLLQAVTELAPIGRYGYGVAAGDQPVGSTRVANWLLGQGLTSLNEGMERGELRRQEDIVQALLRRKREQEEQRAG